MSTQSLSTRAMLVSLSITSWTARKHDKRVTSEVAAQHSANDNVGRYNKNLLPVDAPTYKAVLQAANAARTMHYEQTLPWSDEGARILPASNYMEYTKSMRLHRSAFEKARDAFLADYPQLQRNARNMLNGLYNVEDYPTVDELQDKFSFGTKVLPLPDAHDFRVQLGDDDLTEIRQSIEQEVGLSIHNATADLYQRLFTAVSRMTERLSDDSAVFRDSLVLNIRELCELLPRLNVENDTQLEKLRTDVEARLAGFEPEDLRDNKPLRASVAKMAKKIQDDMSAIMGGAV